MEKIHNSYVSCIKIKGVPILPPLITSERKREIQEYKNQALQLEELYARRRKWESDEAKQDEGRISKSKTFTEHSSNLSKLLTEIKYPTSYVPYETERKLQNLSKDLIDVSEYSSCTDDFINRLNDDHELTTSAVELNLDESFCNEHIINQLESSTEIIIGENLDCDRKETEAPRLIRSNSYTLENPSPILLAHLKRQHSNSASEKVSSDRYEEAESATAESCCSSLEKNRTSIGTEKGNLSQNSVDMNCLDMSENTSPNASVLTANSECQINSFSKPTVELITTDISVQQINITTSINNDVTEKDLMDLLNTNNNTQIQTVEKTNEVYSDIDPESELNLILQQIPEIYSRKIIELIERQKIEQQKRVKNYENLKRGLLHSGDFHDDFVDIPFTKPNEIFVTSVSNSEQTNLFEGQGADAMETTTKTKSISENITPNISSLHRPRTPSIPESQLSTTCSESLEDISSKTVRVIDLESEDGVNYLTYEKRFPLASRDMNEAMRNSSNRNFVLGYTGIQDERILRRAKEEKAASIIVAYAKGFLVRRLMKTTKVQTLIQMIQDALLCALELQKSDTIEEADVELHRRLIQQVNVITFN
ncbi:hypothetical protein HHI36_019073 [Cryptolaemus montrouzieri]|uniref:Uncharacterized protein n=1 Tax=Cryptolaemus montrouzieri TaxID=559131 RepID=A0ABD2P2D6_9CUCU